MLTQVPATHSYQCWRKYQQHTAISVDASTSNTQLSVLTQVPATHSYISVDASASNTQYMRLSYKVYNLITHPNIIIFIINYIQQCKQMFNLYILQLDLHIAEFTTMHCSEINWAEFTTMHCSEINWAEFTTMHCSEINWAEFTTMHCSEINWTVHSNNFGYGQRLFLNHYWIAVTSWVWEVLLSSPPYLQKIKIHIYIFYKFGILGKICFVNFMLSMGCKHY